MSLYRVSPSRPRFRYAPSRQKSQGRCGTAAGRGLSRSLSRVVACGCLGLYLVTLPHSYKRITRQYTVQETFTFTCLGNNPFFFLSISTSAVARLPGSVPRMSLLLRVGENMSLSGLRDRSTIRP
ncbi:hypothetical protein K461DRAFT_13058 [Myriangium duriaei CBS 260.36]|uniref:Uncharacterized protein n=1 Tax=Myriangium duriaei CBS 260.36 TaxID=1168546 RepID=A0A9P4J8D3_9PEZI|nr:hypothetical protein K461DRAFT_13058 [Myriangium duriaei CBS 260.36]